MQVAVHRHLHAAVQHSMLMREDVLQGLLEGGI
jgi:hypothetical protein